MLLRTYVLRNYNPLNRFLNQYLTSTFYYQEIKDTQVLASSLNVETKVNIGVPEKVSASEEYLYRPFSVGEQGARAKVHTKLTLTGKTKSASAPSKFSKECVCRIQSRRRF